MADALQGVLSDLAWGIVAFWVALVGAFVTFAAGLAAAYGLLASFLGAPAAPVDAVATVVAVIGLVATATAIGTAMAQTLSGNLQHLRQQLSDNSGLVPDGSGNYVWPRFDNKGTWRPAT